MPDIGILGTDIHCRDGIGAGLVVQHQGLAGYGGFTLCRTVLHHYGASEGTDSAILGDRLRVDIRSGLRCIVNHFRTGIQILSGSGESNTGKFRSRSLTVQHAHWIEIGYVGSEGTGYPFYGTAFFHQRPLGIQIVHVLGPVLDGGVTQFCIFPHEQLHTAGMEVRHVVLRGGTAFDKMQVCTLVHNDQGMLELSGSRCVQSKIRLQGDRHRHSGGNIYEGAAGPHSTVQRCEFVVSGGHQLHKMLPHHIRIFPIQGTLHIGIDYALGCHFFPDIVIYQLGIVLGAHTGEGLPLRLWDPQFFEGILDVLRHFGPFGAHMGIRFYIGYDVFHVQTLNRGTPVGNFHLIIDLQRL